MMRRVLPSALLAVLLVAPAAKAQVESAGGLSPAARTLARCLETSDRLSVVVLVDESGSLRKTDPLDQRVDGVRATLTGLARLSESPRQADRRTQVEVLLLGFYGKVVPDPADPSALRWRPVNGSTVDDLLAESGRIARRDFGRDTDYATALLGARRALSLRASELTRQGGTSPCKALVWFTDGRFAILDRPAGAAESAGLPTTLPYAPGIRLDRPGGGERAVKAGRSFLCRPGGLMDDLVRDGVVKFTIALSSEIEPADRAFLQGTTTGGPSDCGTDLSQDTGEYLGVDESAQLFFAFSDLFTGGAPLGPKVGVCDRRACPDGTTRFRLVNGMSRAIIRAETGARGVELQLSGPDGERVGLQPAGPREQSTSGVEVTQRWVSNRAAEIEMALPRNAATWQGEWRLVFVDSLGRAVNPQPQYAIQRFVDLVPELVGSPQLVRGRTTPVSFRLVRPGGGGPVSTLLRSATARAQVVDPDSGRKSEATVSGPDANGTFTAQTAIGGDTRAPFTFIDVDVRFDLRDRFAVEPVQRSFRVSSRPPADAGYPNVTPETLSLPSIEGDATTTGTVTITGSPEAGGCAYLMRAEVRGPEEAGRVAVTGAPRATARTSCVRVRAGERKTVRVTFDPEGEAVGSVAGALPFRLISDSTRGEQTTIVSFRFELFPPANVAKRIGIVILLTVLGALLPLLLLHGLNWLGARFAPLHRIRHKTFDVIVDEQGVRREDGTDLEAAYSDLELGSFETEPERRVVQIGSLCFRAVASGRRRDRRLQLLQGPYGMVSDGDGGRVLAGTTTLQSLRRAPDGTTHEVPLSLAGTWVFAVHSVGLADDVPWGGGTDLGGPRQARGSLTLVIADGGSVNQGEELLRDARSVLSAVDWELEAPVSPEEKDAKFLERLRRRNEPPPEAWDEPAEEEPVADDWLSNPAGDLRPPGSETRGPGGHRF